MSSLRWLFLTKIAEHTHTHKHTHTHTHTHTHIHIYTRVSMQAAVWKAGRVWMITVLIYNLMSKLVLNLVLSTSCLPNWCKKKEKKKEKKRNHPPLNAWSAVIFKNVSVFFSPCLISLFLFSLWHCVRSGLVLCRPIQSLWCSSSMHAIFVGTVVP